MHPTGAPVGPGGTGGFSHRKAVPDWEALGGSGEAGGAAKPPSLAFPFPPWAASASAAPQSPAFWERAGGVNKQHLLPGSQSSADVGPQGIVASQL